MPPLRVARRDGHVIEDAKAHAVIGRGVMSGRPHGAERVLRTALDHRIHGIQDAAGGLERDSQRLGAERSVARGKRFVTVRGVVLDDPNVMARMAGG